MNYKKLEGAWKGYYKYGNGYPEQYRNITEAFSIDIKFDGVNFAGTCYDRFTETYFTEPATIQGTFVPNLVSFIKKYPALLTINENMETIVVKDKPSIEIHYTGFYFKGLFLKSIRFEGEWIMTHYYIDDAGKKQYYSCDGRWGMKKIP